MMVQTIVLPSSSNALLTVDGALELRKVMLWIYCAEEDLFVLVHACVGEEQGRVLIGNGGG